MAQKPYKNFVQQHSEQSWSKWWKGLKVNLKGFRNCGVKFKPTQSDVFRANLVARDPKTWAVNPDAEIPCSHGIRFSPSRRWPPVCLKEAIDVDVEEDDR
jgi:hypothetical protein